MEGIVKIVDRAYADTLATLSDQVQRGRADFLPVRRHLLSKAGEREARPSRARRPFVHRILGDQSNKLVCPYPRFTRWSICHGLPLPFLSRSLSCRLRTTGPSSNPGC